MPLFPAAIVPELLMPPRTAAPVVMVMPVSVVVALMVPALLPLPVTVKPLLMTLQLMAAAWDTLAAEPGPVSVRAQAPA